MPRTRCGVCALIEKIISEERKMPKQKSHSGSKKRFDITGSGRVKRAQSGKNHKTGEKPRKRKRSLRQTAFVNETQEATVRNMIPYKK